MAVGVTWVLLRINALVHAVTVCLIVWWYMGTRQVWKKPSHELFNFPEVGSSHGLPVWAANALAERQQRVLDHVNSFHSVIEDEFNSLRGELENSTVADPERIPKRMFLEKLKRLLAPLAKFTVNGIVHSNTAARRVHETKKRPLYLEAGEKVNLFDYVYSPK
eukprot:793081-Rhodomonas_salina.1